jgi:ABC-type Fe3+-siderophore transport system permease subunit
VLSCVVYDLRMGERMKWTLFWTAVALGALALVVAATVAREWLHAYEIGMGAIAAVLGAWLTIETVRRNQL